MQGQRQEQRQHPAILRNNVHVTGRPDGRTLLFVHGFGCDQTVWRHVAPHFEADYRVAALDLTGMGGSTRAAYDRRRHGNLEGHADDIIEVTEAIGRGGGDRRAVFIGHSVSAVIGALAVVRRPDLYSALVMVTPNPCYINEPGYRGGFERSDVDGLLETLDSNYLDWSAHVAPIVAGDADKPGVGEELTALFCRNDPAIARHFARVTFLSDNRGDMGKVKVPTLILQDRDDALAPESVGEFVHKAIQESRLVRLQAIGHAPILTAPAETTKAIREFLGKP